MVIKPGSKLLIFIMNCGSGKAPIERIIEISERMHNQAKRAMEKREFISRKVGVEEENQEECTFKPNISKQRFRKFPNPPGIRKQDETVFGVERESKEKGETKRKEKGKLYPPSRLSLYYRWEEKRKQKALDNFISSELCKSVEQKRQPSPQRNSESTNDHYYLRPINRSLSPKSPARGEEQFYNRQRIARLRKEQKDYKLKNPWAHTCTFTWQVESKIDASLTHFMSLGSENYSRRQPSRYI